MKLSIDLLRHGETELSHTLRGSTDDHLTENGWLQMQQTVASRLGQGVTLSPWDVVFTSTLKRCSLFAEQFAGQAGLPLYNDSALQEMHFGEWEAVPVQSIYESSPELLSSFWQQPSRFTPPGAETLQAFHIRITEALERISIQMQKHAYQHALVVTHGGVIKLLKCIALEQPLDELLKMSAELGQLNRFDLDTETMKLHIVKDTL